MYWCFNATFNNISVISWRSVLLVEENGVYIIYSFRTITLVLYIGSLTNLATLFPYGRGRTLIILGSFGPSLVKFQYTELKLSCGNDPVVKYFIYSNGNLDL
jgi:hypothetical protein